MSVNILTQNGLQRIHTARVLKDYRVINGIESDVNFYDYDGTLIDAYTNTEFLALFALPPNPTHEGLTAQGWNWDLNDAKDYVRDYGKLNIGQMYITSDGKTRIYIHLEEGRLNPELNLKFTEDGSFTVDWGDGTTLDTVSGSIDTLGTIVHTYAAAGDYVIAVTVDSGKVSIVGDDDIYIYSPILKKPNVENFENRVYNNCIKQIEIGSNIINIEPGAFGNCHSLISITIPRSVTSIGASAFGNCHSLISITIPSGVTSIEAGIVDNCYSLTSIIIPNSVISIEHYIFGNCNSLTSVIIPSSVTNIGSYAFFACHSLTSIIIPNSVTSIGTCVFYNCHSLGSATIPNSVTSTGSNTFENCYSLISVTIPNSVTNIETNAFQNCYSLSSVTIPSGVTSIGTDSFYDCYGLGFIKFEGKTPPTVSGSNTFRNVPTDCIIYVPEGSLSAYTSAQYYPNPNTYTYIEYQE